MIPPASLPTDNCTAFALGWINLTTLLLRRFASLGLVLRSRFGGPKGKILRIPSPPGFNPDGKRRLLNPGPSPFREPWGAGPSSGAGSEAQHEDRGGR